MIYSYTSTEGIKLYYNHQIQVFNTFSTTLPDITYSTDFYKIGIHTLIQTRDTTLKGGD